MPVGLAMLVAFGGGIVSFASPCILPLVPVYLSVLTGADAAALAGHGRAPATAVPAIRPALSFVAGFTVVFVLLGSTASAAGRLLAGDHLVLSRVAGAVIIAMAAFLVAAQLVSTPLLGREFRFPVRRRMGVWGPPVAGAAFAFGWTPCIGPVLASVLAVASVQGQASRGAALLCAYSLGLGVPFVAAGVAVSRFAAVSSWLRRHGRVISLASAALMAALGVLVLIGRLSLLSGGFGVLG